MRLHARTAVGCLSLLALLCANALVLPACAVTIRGFFPSAAVWEQHDAELDNNPRPSSNGEHVEALDIEAARTWDRDYPEEKHRWERTYPEYQQSSDHDDDRAPLEPSHSAALIWKRINYPKFEENDPPRVVRQERSPASLPSRSYWPQDASIPDDDLERADDGGRLSDALPYQEVTRERVEPSDDKDARPGVMGHVDAMGHVWVPSPGGIWRRVNYPDFVTRGPSDDELDEASKRHGIPTAAQAHSGAGPRREPAPAGPSSWNNEGYAGTWEWEAEPGGGIASTGGQEHEDADGGDSDEVGGVWWKPSGPRSHFPSHAVTPARREPPPTPRPRAHPPSPASQRHARPQPGDLDREGQMVHRASMVLKGASMIQEEEPAVANRVDTGAHAIPRVLSEWVEGLAHADASVRLDDPAAHTHVSVPSPPRAHATRMRTPDFFVVGVQKSGTSTLWSLLARHPRVRWGPSKEVFYFSHHCGGHVNQYLRIMNDPPVPPGALLGDFTADRFNCLCCPQLVREINPDAKIIVLLRSPVQRAASRYYEQLSLEHNELARMQRHNIMHGPAGFPAYALALLQVVRTCTTIGHGLPFCLEKENILGWSYYSPFLRLWLDHFGPLRLLVLYTEELERDALDTVHMVEDFLGLERHDYGPRLASARYNSRGCYGWSSVPGGKCEQKADVPLTHMDKDTLSTLHLFYDPMLHDIKEMADRGQIRRPPPGWGRYREE